MPEKKELIQPNNARWRNPGARVSKRTVPGFTSANSKAAALRCRCMPNLSIRRQWMSLTGDPTKYLAPD
jgi:hypothetical protein